MKKRILSIVLTICMVLMYVPTTAFAASNGSCGTDLTWQLNDNGTLTITGTGAMYDWSSNSDLPWYANCSSIKTIVIDSGVTSIGNMAFANCTSLTSVTIPDSVKSIGMGAFFGCTGLTGVTIPDSVTSIGNSAFSGCTGLTSITIPDSVESIGNSVFSGCKSLTSVTIPDSVTYIGSSAFRGCTGLTNVTIPSSVTTIGTEAFRDCTGLTSVTIPSSVTTIEMSTFVNCTSLTSVTIPNSVTSIKDAAFQHCTNLTSVTIPDSVTSIGDYTFYECTGLTKIEIPDSVTSIENAAFRDCTGLTSITIPNSVTSIGEYAFQNCSSLASITIPNSVKSIGNRAFYSCRGLTSINIPNGVTSIGNNAFEECINLTNIEIPNSVTYIGYKAFDPYNLNSIFLPKDLDVTNVDIPNHVTKVKYSIENGEVTITGITLGTNKTSVDIPAEICGHSVVAVADNYQTLVGTHTCKGGTATCTARALCDICGQEYGALKEHTYNWQSQDGKYWGMCRNCGAEITKKDIPTITITGADSVCATQDYEFSFTLPQGVTDATYGWDFGNRGFGGIDPTINNGKMCGEIAANLYGTSEGSFKIIIDAKTADGFDFSVSKTVSLNKEHSDSEPKDHLCDICGEIVSGHNLENIPAKDATVTETGNKEYWHCKDCGKYFSDENGKSEINDLAEWKAEEGKLAKLPPEIINGKGMSIAAGENKELTFRSNADFSDFIRVELDGKTLDAKYYTAKEGSTIITLKADYVATLSAGDHTIGIVSTSGTATTEFTVNAQAAGGNDSPKTGDNSNLLLWIALIFVSGGMMTAAGGYRKRENYS